MRRKLELLLLLTWYLILDDSEVDGDAVTDGLKKKLPHSSFELLKLYIMRVFAFVRWRERVKWLVKNGGFRSFRSHLPNVHITTYNRWHNYYSVIYHRLLAFQQHRNRWLQCYCVKICFGWVEQNSNRRTVEYNGLACSSSRSTLGFSAHAFGDDNQNFRSCNECGCGIMFV